ncbi:hypothetical protein KCTC52924_02858 [Arenibacter antarcticus]
MDATYIESSNLLPLNSLNNKKLGEINYLG